jgi:acetolactate synthase-1/2/3 large subunit
MRGDLSENTPPPSHRADVVGGHVVARRLKAHGVTTVFTLSGGHIFPIYDGCREEGIAIVDVRHEQSAAFAAEGWAKVTREPGVVAVTAGPGVTNAISAIASAQQNHSPMLVLGGRAPDCRWGQGSLQELDHVPIVAPLAKFAATAHSTGAIAGLIDDALAAAVAPHGGAAFVDIPLDHVYAEGPDGPVVASLPSAADGPAPGEQQLARAVALLRDARRPVVMAGTDLYWGHGEDALRELAERLRIPVFLNGLARGCLPADHELFFSRARREALRDADVVLLVGAPMDFRLGFGAVFGDATALVVVDRVEPERAHARAVAAELYGAIGAALSALGRDAGGAGSGGPGSGGRNSGGRGAGDRDAWVSRLRATEQAARDAEQAERADDRAPLHPMRVYAELGELLDRDAIVIGDGGDFVSYAGRVIDSYEPGCWLDPGPFGCLGSGPGYALAAKLARPQRQVVLLLGDGAFGFGAMEFDTLVRHGVNVVGIVGNNGIWGLEKHPMELIYGYSVAAELRPQTRYDGVVEALGGHGELVRTPAQLRPALERAFEARLPALVNVLTDPAVAYPRRSNLA